MIDRKIQNMEKAASDGSEIDREVIKHKLEQLHHERTTLPTNYGKLIFTLFSSALSNSF